MRENKGLWTDWAEKDLKNLEPSEEDIKNERKCFCFKLAFEGEAPAVGLNDKIEGTEYTVWLNAKWVNIKNKIWPVL